MTVSLMPAGQFLLPDLRLIYNQSRTGYLVPMQMKAGDLAKYINRYQVDLTQSLVAMQDGDPVGLGMLAIRESRSWITRVGVNPDQRGAGIGKKIIEGLLENSDKLGIPVTILEVISKNRPAYKLFSKLGFQKTRGLLILDKKAVSHGEKTRSDNLPSIHNLNREETLERLAGRTGPIAWTGQIESYRQMKGLLGYSITQTREGSPWLAFNRNQNKITHLTWGGDQSQQQLGALLDHLAAEFPSLPARIENIPSDHPMQDLLFNKGFEISFKRVEMLRTRGEI